MVNEPHLLAKNNDINITTQKQDKTRPIYMLFWLKSLLDPMMTQSIERYTVRRCYNMVQYDIILHTAL